MNIPEVRLQSSMLLFNSISEDERKLWADSINQDNLSFTEIQNYTTKLSESWDVYGDLLLKSMSSIYGIEFKKNIIDVYVNPWNKSISNPLILNPSRPPEVQIDTIMHELLHVLFTDNTSFSMHNKNQNITLIEKWRALFGEDLEWKTIVHIPVHAGLKALFLDVINQPDRLERDIRRHDNNPAYKKAWEYVEENDYKVINNKLKELYESLTYKSSKLVH